MNKPHMCKYPMRLTWSIICTTVAQIWHTVAKCFWLNFPRLSVSEFSLF
jgi:hypothetical protein